MKKSMIKSLLTLILVLTLLVCCSTAALALDNAWEGWQPTQSGGYTRLTCLDSNIGEADLFRRIQQLIAEEKGDLAADYACYQLRFPYTPGHISAAALERYFFDRFAHFDTGSDAAGLLLDGGPGPG